MEIVSAVRAYAFLAHVFESQQHDPFCRACKALVNSAAATKESLATFESEHAVEIRELPAAFWQSLTDAKNMLAELTMPEHASGQKKAGNCKLPEGVCFVKSSRAILQKI